MNNIGSIITRLYQEGSFSKQNMTSFQPGQIFNGKIIKLFPNGIASLQIGSQKIVAQLEAQMEAGKNYWFQVLPNEGKVRLKVLSPTKGRMENGKDSIIGLLKSLSLPVNEENKELIHFYLKEGLPVNKNYFQETARWIKEFGSDPAAFEAIKQIEEKQMPITKRVFQAILEVIKNESLSEQITTLYDLLKDQSLSNKGKELAEVLQSMMKEEMDSEGVRKYMEQVQKDTIQKEILKPLLIEFIKEEHPTLIKEIAEKLLNKIIGFQLFSQDTGPIQHLIVQIPICLWNKLVDLTIQWSGKKKENGQMDPEFCRVLFYLELENFKETIVDMQIQKRIVSLKIANEKEEFKQIATPLIDQLIENLDSLQYHLSSVQFIQPSKQKGKKDSNPLAPKLSSEYGTGVDFRV